ncbi:PREDICTED: uncharacterized protein LOC105452944 isoform X2 [Wasmannia auropunctata]|uniref:uncharacterized protein LOC105452944 isoform X2 n=1 Tax=Wasmannia auropunctata TaxID=64793 RepID=UPI0005EE0C50|nr:PREDICTED: uncharacterized protein LOC105452944 isoform X2 [Wasmannia auropunctata]
MVEATSQTRSDNINANGKRRETRDYSLWTSSQLGKIWSQVHDACKNVVKLAATSIGRVVRDARKSERSQRNPVEVADATLVESASSCAGKICGETCRKNLMRPRSGEKTKAHQERAIGDVGKYRGDTEAPMRKNSRAIAPSRRDVRRHAYQSAEKEENGESCVNYSEYERDRYQDIVEFPPRSETYSRDEEVHSQSRSSESFAYHENSTYPGLRNRGGSDDNQDFARGTVDEKSVQRIYEDAGSVRPQNFISKKSQHVICYELSVVSVTTDRQAIRADMPAASRNNPHEPQSASISSPEDNEERAERSAAPEQTRSRDETKTRESIEDTIGAETERSFTPAIADASSAEANPAVHSSRNDPDEPTASTSKWETSSVSLGKSRKNRPGGKSPFCATTMKFWRRRLPVDNKTTAPVLKRSRRSIGRKELSSTYGSGVKIMQIEPSTVQTAREGNKRRAYVNIQVQTPDAIVTGILSEFILSGEKRRRVLMSIMLQSESDDEKEAETQTSSNDITSGEISYPDKRPCSITKTVQCFMCDKPDCYEIRQSDNSISLEEALIAEYPETSELNDYLAERKADVKIPP